MYLEYMVTLHTYVTGLKRELSCSFLFIFMDELFQECRLCFNLVKHLYTYI